MVAQCDTKLVRGDGHHWFLLSISLPIEHIITQTELSAPSLLSQWWNQARSSVEGKAQYEGDEPVGKSQPYTEGATQN